MQRSICALVVFSAFASAMMLSCGGSATPDSHCIFTAIQDMEQADDGEGLLQIDGSTSAYYLVLDEADARLKHERLNHPVVLDAGSYQVEVNGSRHTVSVEDGKLLRCATGTLIVSGKSSEAFDVTDTATNKLASQVLGKPLSLFPGEFIVRVNNTETSAIITSNQLTKIRTGSLLVQGDTDEHCYVLDRNNRHLNVSRAGEMTSFIPGTYEVKVNNTSLRADVVAGRVTELHTGTVVVNGLTEEYYYITDTIGSPLTFQELGKRIALFPGRYNLKVNNTRVTADVAAGRTTQFDTGSLTLTGSGTEYYYVFDASGSKLNYSSLNRSLSFFPAEYTVKLGTSARKATVIAGQLTALEAFHQ